MPREHTPDSKFQLRNRGELQAPGECFICSSGNRDEGYVDTTIFFDYEGTMYICVLCLEEMLEATGGLSAAEAKILLEQTNYVAEENARLTKELDDAKQRLASFDSLLEPLRASVNSAILNSPNLEEFGNQSGHSTADIDAVTDDSGSGESKSEESVTEPGPNDPELVTVRNGSKRKQRGLIDGGLGL